MLAGWWIASCTVHSVRGTRVESNAIIMGRPAQVIYDSELSQANKPQKKLIAPQTDKSEEECLSDLAKIRDELETRKMRVEERNKKKQRI